MTLTKTLAQHLPTPLEKLPVNLELDLWMKRDDLIHPIIAGNKWRKLAGFFQDLPNGTPVLTFGGAYSNHLAAAASALQAHSCPAVFIVRGEELNPQSSPVLEHCQAMGARLLFVSRQEFRFLREAGWQPTKQQKQSWQLDDNCRILAEGGTGSHNLFGCAQLWQELEAQGIPDELWLAAGTAGTAQGLLKAMPNHCPTHVHVVSAVKGAKREESATLALAASKHIQLTWMDETEFGGFAKSAPRLEICTAEFLQATAIVLDPVYNAKVWWHLRQHQGLDKGKVVWINTGGLRLATPSPAPTA